ncbi:hypothetical protein L7F22_015710 [Adiantum nelumboides]|nr:hypothetical protein [Adiantum nelumboides]
MKELKLHKAVLIPNEEEMAKLETLIQIRKEALKDMGLDIEVHNLDNLGEEAAQLQAWYLSMAQLSWIGDVQEPNETVEDIAAKQDADVTPDKVEEDQESAVCPEIEEILPNCPTWGYLVSNFARSKSSSSLISMDYS